VQWLPRARLMWVAPLGSVAGVGAFIAILNHPLMPVYRHILWKVVSGH